MANYKKLCEILKQCVSNKCRDCYCEDDIYCSSHIKRDAVCAIEELQAENERLKKQLDAAVADIKQAHKIGNFDDGMPIYDCDICNFCSMCRDNDCACETHFGERFEWRGWAKMDEKDGDTNG